MSKKLIFTLISGTLLSNMEKLGIGPKEFDFVFISMTIQEGCTESQIQS